MPPVMDEAICIRQWEWSETSQTVALFSRAMGIVRALAKGSRRPKAPYSGGVDVLTRGRIGVIVRPRSDLALLTEWDLVESFPGLRSNLRVHNAGLYIADIIHHAIHDHDPHTALYDATVESLRLLRGPGDVQPALLKFQWSVLVETGYRPVLDADVRTGEALPRARAFLFNPALGGVTPDVSADGAPEPGLPAGRTWRVRSQTIDFLCALDAGGLAAVSQVTDPHAPERANRLLATYLRYVLGVEPPTMPVVFGPRLPR